LATGKELRGLPLSLEMGDWAIWLGSKTNHAGGTLLANQKKREEGRKLELTGRSLLSYLFFQMLFFGSKKPLFNASI